MEKGIINLVIAKNLDRFGRYATEVMKYYQEYFPDNNIRFMTVLNEKIDTLKGVDDMVSVKAVMDEIYPRNLSKNIKAVKFSKAKQGLFQGNTAPYGYKKSPTDKHKLIIDEEVAPVVKKIFTMYSQGYTRVEIVDELNSLKILPPRKHLKMEKTEKGLKGVDFEDYSWKEHTITEMIGNEVYIGTMVGMKTLKPNFRKKNRKANKKMNQVRVCHTHEPIIDMKTFEECQEIRKKHLDKTCKYDDIFKGIVHCGDCGKPSNLKHKAKTKKDGSTCEIFSYLCSEANKGAKKTCNNTKSISSKKLYNIIQPALEKQCKTVIIDKADIEKITENIQKSFSYEVTRLEEEYQKYTDKIKNINMQIKQIYNDKLENKITEELFLDIQQEKQKEIEQYKIMCEQIKNEIALEKEKNVISFEEIEKLANDFLHSDTLDKKLVHKLVRRIELDSDRHLKVQFTFADVLKEVC